MARLLVLWARGGMPWSCFYGVSIDLPGARDGALEPLL